MLRCGLLGETLGHSYSPMIHHELGEYDYRLFEVSKEDLDAFLCSDRWDGLNVTIPYKKAVVPYCAELSEAAERLQSVNTLVRRPDGTLYGDQHRPVRLSLHGPPQQHRPRREKGSGAGQRRGLRHGEGRAGATGR